MFRLGHEYGGKRVRNWPELKVYKGKISRDQNPKSIWFKFCMYTSLGVHLSRRFLSRTGRKEEKCFLIPANPPGERGIFGGFCKEASLKKVTS